MALTEEYRKSLKMAEAEELLDLTIYRPIAFVLVKLIYRLPITPNQVTYGALVAGLISAWQFARGTVEGFAWGAAWYAIANVLDCGDGMLARLQKSGTPLGRLVDGVVDWISSVAIFAGLGVGLHAYTGNPLIWVLVSAAGVLSGYHAMMFDKRQQEYISAVRGERNFIKREHEKIDEELRKLDSAGSNPFRRLLLKTYVRYMSVQEGAASGVADAVVYPPDLYRKENQRIMRWWTWLGPTTNRTLLMGAALLAHPEWFCWLVVVPANLYLIGISRWQRNVTHRLDDIVKSRGSVAAAA